MTKSLLLSRFRIGSCFIAAVVLAAGCESAVEPVLLAWEGDLVASSPAGVTGSVAVATQFGRTDASVLISGAQSETTYGWRINTGNCASPGAIVGGQAVYPDLETSAQGSASAETTFAELLEEDETYAARVYLDAGAGAETVVGCADLERVN